MNKADVCINHTIAHSYGSHNDWGQHFVRNMIPRPGINSLSFEKLLSYLDPPADDDKSVESFFAANIQRHGTSIHSFVKDSKRYVWYNNPWGFNGDKKYHNYSPWPRDFYQVGIDDSSVNDLKRRGLKIPLHLKLTYAEVFKMNALRVLEQAEFMDGEFGYGLIDKFRSWDKLKRGDSKSIGHSHPMGVLYFLKLIFHADHLEVLHPSETMPAIGPQNRGEGLDDDVPCSAQHGACALWTSMYVEKVRDIIGSRVSNARAETLVHLVKTSLTKNSLFGSYKDATSLRFMMARGVDDREYSMKALMSLVYDVIPEKEFILGSHPNTRKRKLSSVSTGWHSNVFRKLGRLVEILEREHKTHGKVEDDGTGVTMTKKFLKADTKYEDKIIAGFIETLAIVSGEDETNKGLTYLDKTGFIAAFVVHNRMGDLGYLQLFVDAAKFLISCKHNDDPENADTPRAEYSGRAPTRSARERHDRILRDTHSELFKYNLADRQREIEELKSSI